MADESRPDIALVIVTEKLNEENTAFTAIENFYNIFNTLAKTISIFGPKEMSIDGDQINLHSINRQDWTTPILQIISHLYLQVRLGYKLAKNRNEVDVVFFHLGGTILVVPLLVSRVLRKHPVVIVTGSVRQSYIEHHKRTPARKIIAMCITILETMSSQLASRMVFLSESMKSQFKMIENEHRITANINYIDIDNYDNQNGNSNRKFDFIFVGRFERIKGVVKFVQAVSMLIQERPDIQVVLVGDGTLRPQVERTITRNGLEDNIELTGWVEHEAVIKYLGDARYLVLPSESEGVPKTLLEAMACGTVPIATKVGGVPDIIEQKKTGFLLSDNESDLMSEEIVKYTDEGEWEVLSAHAREYIRSEHSFKKRRQEYERLLRDILSKNPTIEN